MPPSTDDLKAFSAAFGTSASVPLFHLAGITPEAATLEHALSLGMSAEDDMSTGILEAVPVRMLTLQHLEAAYARLDGGASRVGSPVEFEAATDTIQLVALGNPHFSLAECAKLAGLVAASGERCRDDVSIVATLGRASLEEARRRGYARTLEAFGVTLVSDTCWCMLSEPIVPPTAQTLLTNSAKYAHYGPGLTGKRVRFASLSGCVEAAVSGRMPMVRPAWLSGRSTRAKPRGAGGAGIGIRGLKTHAVTTTTLIRLGRALRR
mmetsp:Transcript_2980/g.8309  ORF Transcript_2980/g.8309 Transcript_2980/m.8309 type:complete len:265 (+) Transcript_2980:302-1096(+)